MRVAIEVAFKNIMRQFMTSFCRREKLINRKKFGGSLRDGETTIKIKFSLLRGGPGGQRGQLSKNAVSFLFVGNATTRKC